MPTLDERFFAKVRFTDGCWLWTGTRNQAGNAGGYGQLQVKVDGDWRRRLAHRISYENIVGPIPDGMELDHLCRVPFCVRPDHLEPVSHRENQLRGDTIAARNAAVTHCPQGHPYDEANTCPLPRGGRACRACARERMRANRNRKET